MNTNKLKVLTPENCQLIFIDHQPQMAFGVQSIDRQTLKNNVIGLAKAARIFHIPTIITTVETDSFSGPTYPELLDVFPNAPLLERTSMNSWDDQNVAALDRDGSRQRCIDILQDITVITSYSIHYTKLYEFPQNFNQHAFDPLLPFGQDKVKRGLELGGVET